MLNNEEENDYKIENIERKRDLILLLIRVQNYIDLNENSTMKIIIDLISKTSTHREVITVFRGSSKFLKTGITECS